MDIVFIKSNSQLSQFIEMDKSIEVIGTIGMIRELDPQ